MVGEPTQMEREKARELARRDVTKKDGVRKISVLVSESSIFGRKSELRIFLWLFSGGKAM